MSIGAITRVAKTTPSDGAPFFDLISFAGDDAYATGGTAAFEDAVQAKCGDQRKVLGVIGQGCGGYKVTYDRANDKLQVWQSDGTDAPDVEVDNAADLSAVTFNLIVISY